MNCGQKKVIIDGESLLLASLLINQPLAPACRRKPSRLFIFFHFLPIQLPFSLSYFNTEQVLLTNASSVSTSQFPVNLLYSAKG